MVERGGVGWHGGGVVCACVSVCVYIGMFVHTGSSSM